MCVPELRKLKLRLCAVDVKQDDLMMRWSRSREYVSQRFRGLRCFALDEAYDMMDLIHEPYESLPKFIPPVWERNAS